MKKVRKVREDTEWETAKNEKENENKQDRGREGEKRQYRDHGRENVMRGKEKER